MKINGYLFPSNNCCEFISKEKTTSGQQWSDECLALSAQIAHYDEINWLLYHDDFYQFSIYFFALLIANKNIVLAQSNLVLRADQSAKVAAITIGDITSTTLPHFQPTASIISPPPENSCSLDLNANSTITLFTSGSSGEAKAVKKYWYQLVNEVEALEALFADNKQMSYVNYVLATVTHKHIYGLLFKLLWPVFTNKKIVTQTVEYPEQTEHYCQQLKNIFFISSPSYLARTTEELSQDSASNINKIFSSGGPLTNQTAHSFAQLYNKNIIEIYGSTETGGIAWRKQEINKQWLLFDQHEVSLAPDKTLLLKSAFIEKNTIIKTDDCVNLTGRYFDMLGRVDRIIKLHEKRLSLDEIEQYFLSLSSIKACHCLLITSPKVQLAAVIQLTDKQQLPKNNMQKRLLTKRLKKELSKAFDPSLLPKKWRYVEKIPYNSQGKLIKAEVETLFTPQSE